MQGEIDRALSTVLRSAVSTVGAGRTDAGVHATGQVVSFAFGGDVPDDLDRRVTALCRPDLSVLSVAAEVDGFHARFSARWRRYRYLILNRAAPDPLRRLVAWHVPEPLPVEAMSANGQAAVGEHDFASFCRVPEGGHAVRRVDSVTVDKAGDEVRVVVVGESFCHQMVRSLVGTLVAGIDVAQALGARSRAAAGPVAPPHGLCLEEVSY